MNHLLGIGSIVMFGTTTWRVVGVTKAGVDFHVQRKDGTLAQGHGTQMTLSLKEMERRIRKAEKAA